VSEVVDRWLIRKRGRKRIKKQEVDAALRSGDRLVHALPNAAVAVSRYWLAVCLFTHFWIK
jgi:hypothetical protein